MHIWSWNVNGIRACHRKEQLLPLLARDTVDVLCLQEIKALPEQVPEEVLDGHGCHIAWGPAERKGYSGVATFSKVEPDEVIVGLGVEKFDVEGRTITTRYGNLLVVNCYFPHGQRDHARLPYKTEYYRTLKTWAEARRAEGFRMVICGDWNTAHQAVDIKNDKANRKTSGFTEPERALIDEYVDLGWHDSFRKLYPNAEDVYTWWSNRAGVRERNVGWRIDYHFVSDELWSSVSDAKVHADIMGSDHCPIELTLAI